MKNRVKHKILFTILAYLSINFFSFSQDKTKIEASTGVLTKVDSLEGLLKKSNDTSQVIILYKLTGEYNRSNPEMAIQYGQEGLKLAEKLEFKKGISKCLNNMGIVHFYQGNFEKAMENWLEALRIRENIADKKGIASCLNNIGNIYSSQGDIINAIDYYQQSLKIDQELGNKKGIATSLYNMGEQYRMQGKYEEAMSNYRHSLKISEELKDESGISLNLIGIGNVYKNQGDYEKAIDYLRQSLKINEGTGDKQRIAVSLHNIGEIYSKLGSYDKAIEYNKTSLALSKEIGYKNLMKYIFQDISEIYSKQSQYKQAYEYYRLYSEIKDTLFNEEKSKEIGKLEAKHEFETAEIERKRKLEELTRIESEQKSRRDNLQYSGILIFLLVLLIAITFSGRLALPIRLAEGTVFFTFLLLFEFLLVYLDPYVDNWTNGEPAYKLAINAGLAGLIFPLHSFFETKLKRRIKKE